MVGSTPVHHPATSAVSQQVFLPQNEQLHEISQATELQDIVDLTNATGPSVDVREPVSLEASDNEKVGNQRAVDFVSCHGATSTFAGNVNDSSSTLAEIFRCFICLGKVSRSISRLSCCLGSGYDFFLKCIRVSSLRLMILL